MESIQRPAHGADSSLGVVFMAASMLPLIFGEGLQFPLSFSLDRLELVIVVKKGFEFLLPRLTLALRALFQKKY